MLRDLVNARNRNLIREFVIANFKIRYKGSLTGIFWSILHPVLIFIILYIVFYHYMKYEVQFYPFFLALGVIQWAFFERSTVESIFTIARYTELIKKTIFPKEILVISAVLSNFIGFISELIILIIFMLIIGINFKPTALLFLLVAIVELFIILGISFMLSVSYIYYQNLDHLWNILLRMGFFATPIIYPVSIVPKKFHWIFKFNPLAYLVNFGRDILIYNKFPNRLFLIFLILFSVFLLSMSYLFFKKLEPLFAEKV